MTVAEIKAKQYKRFDTAIPDVCARALVLQEGYFLVTEDELNELYKINTP